jgi:cytochrome P450
MAMTTAGAPHGCAKVAPPPRRALAHIPGGNGLPLIGSTLQVLADPKGYYEALAARHGPVVRVNILGETGVQLLGPEANELVLFDSQRLFSAQFGWNRFLDRVFPRGLLTLDFEEHRLQRRALAVAFKAGPLRAYLATLNAGIAAAAARWRAAPGPMVLYPEMKRLTLDLAARSFLGADIGPETEGIRAAFVDMVAATVAPIRRPLPATQMRRGVQGRARIVEFLARQVPVRRKSGGDDLFTQLCHATTEDGEPLPAQAVVDHMSFLMMAAHDTLTTSLTALVWLLAANPRWQDRLRDEVVGLGLRADEPLPFERLDELRLTEMAFEEALRIIPPVPVVPRRALRDFEFGGHPIPAGTSIGVNPLFTHHMPSLWPDPDRFDPDRFGEAARAGRRRGAYVPFGGGAHMCLGLNFAVMQAKCFARHLLQNLSVGITPGYVAAWRMWPIPQPKDGMQLHLASIG